MSLKKHHKLSVFQKSFILVEVRNLRAGVNWNTFPPKALGKCLFWLLPSCLPIASCKPQMACVYLVSMSFHILLPLCFCAHFHYTHVACTCTQIYTHICPFAHTCNMNHNSLGQIIFIENRFFFHSTLLNGSSPPFSPLSSPQPPLLSKSTPSLFPIRKE